MNEKTIREQIKQLTVQIITPKERGTGVLIYHNNRPSILTVHHCIYGKKSKLHPIEADEVKFVFSNKAEYFALDIEVIGELVILALDCKMFTLQLPSKVELAEVEYGQNYYIRGFPLGLDKAHNFKAKCNDIERETFKIEIENLTNDTSGEDAIEYMRGVSGSGIFFARDNKLYLVGLINALANQSGTFNAVVCLNLCKLLTNKTSSTRSSFNYWFWGFIVLGVLAFIFYPKDSVSPKSVLTKKSMSLKPSILSEKKRAVLHLNKSKFNQLIEDALSKKVIIVDDEKKAKYIIEIDLEIEQQESVVYGSSFVKSSCQLNIKTIELQEHELQNSESYNTLSSGFDKQISANNCVKNLLIKLDGFAF